MHRLGETPSEGPPSNPFRRIRFVGLFLWVGAAVVLAAATLVAFEAAGVRISQALVRNVSLLLVYAALLLWLGRGLRARGLDSRGFFRPPRRWSWTEILGLTALLVAFSIGSTWVLHTALANHVPELVERRLQSVEVLTPPDVPHATLFNAVEVVALVFLVPFAEELFFRGFLLNRWGRGWTVGTAVLASAALFALLHVDVVGKLFFGIVLSILYLETGSLVVPVVVHALNNALAVGVVLLAAYAPDLGVEPMLGSLQGGRVALALFLVTFPIVLLYVVRHWPAKDVSPPDPGRLDRVPPNE